MTLGIPVGLFVIVAAFVLTGIYVHRANSEFDALTRQIIEKVEVMSRLRSGIGRRSSLLPAPRARLARRAIEGGGRPACSISPPS